MYRLVFFLFFISLNLAAQNLTGKWVSVQEMATDYYAEMHLVESTPGIYFGHNYDREGGGSCRFWLKARFVGNLFMGKDDEKIFVNGQHSPTRYELRYSETPEGEFLEGKVYTYNVELVQDMYGRFVEKEKYTDYPNFVRYKKVTSDYKPYSEEDFKEVEPVIMTDVEKEPAPKPTPPPVPEIAKPKEPLEVVKEEAVVKEEDTPLGKIDNEQLKELKLGRKEKVVSTIRAKSNKIKFKIQDFGTEDNDTVTIFLNDSILAKRIRIERKPKWFELELPQGKKVNKLVFVANNLGDIPPNSAEIKIWIADQEFYYKLFSDDKFNAVIRLDNLNARKEE